MQQWHEKTRDTGNALLGAPLSSLAVNLGLTLVVGEKLLSYLLRGGSKLP
jgi:hypothetical protein